VFELSTWRSFSKIRSHSSAGTPGPVDEIRVLGELLGGETSSAHQAASRYAANDVRTARRSNNTPPTVGFRFGNRLRNQRHKAPFYTLKSATKLPNLIDFACWAETLNQRVEGSSFSTPTMLNFLIIKRKMIVQSRPY
jgi:hypothetical protein